MVNEQMNTVVVFRTGQVYQIDMAVNALKEAHVPYMTEEETASGFRLAMPVGPAPGPGVCWTLRVPASEVDKAKQVLSELPFEIKTSPGAWDFNPRPGVKKVWRISIVVTLVLMALAAAVLLIVVFR
jgi:hypothetical protein